MPDMASPNSSVLKSVAPLRTLIVEDDRTMEPLWRYIVEAASPGSTVDWVTSGEAAGHAMVALGDHGYDLIVADIFLGGQTTGLDLWQLLADDSQCAFILMSVLSPQRLAILAQSSPRPLPSYLQKPLDPQQCIETVRALCRR